MTSIVYLDWQTVVALMIVIGAGLALMPRMWRFVRGDYRPGCGGCGDACSTKDAKVITKPIVDLSEIADRRKTNS